MPLLDHIHPPLDQRFHWESFHSNWATRLADGLAAILPPEFQVEEHCHLGSSLEIDIATFKGTEPATKNGPVTPTQTLATWAPPAPQLCLPTLIADTFEVRIFSTLGGLTMVAAIELVSPGNKDRPEERRAFAIKCASLLHQGICVVMIDVVTSRKANLHNETLRLLGTDPSHELPSETNLYAAAYRPVQRQNKAQIDIWTATCALGERLPEMPLRLTGDLFVPIDFEAAYLEACRRRRIA